MDMCSQLWPEKLPIIVGNYECNDINIHVPSSNNTESLVAVI